MQYPCTVEVLNWLPDSSYCFIAIRDARNVQYRTNNLHPFGAYLCGKYNEGDTVMEAYNYDEVRMRRSINKQQKEK